MDAQTKEDIQNTIKKVVTVFTAQYTKAYVLAMVRWIKLETQKQPKDWHLESRPPVTRPLMEGFIEKESVHLKKWNNRYFVFRPNFTVDYYDSKELSEAVDPKTGVVGPKPRGSLNLSGYYVEEDPNKGALQRIAKLAKQMGIDTSGIPKPKEYPPLTFEVHHSRRPCYYLKAKNQEEFNKWVAQFKSACWNARAYSWDDWCHQRAYPIALRKTRWELGRWGWWGGAGSEEQMLAELIADELEWDIMGRIYSKLPGPWIIRNKMRNMTLSTIDGMILAAVKPAWAAMRKAVEELRPKMEPIIKRETEPIFKAELEIVGKMKETVMGALEPALNEKVSPHLGKIVSIIKSPMHKAFSNSIDLFDAQVSKWTPKDNEWEKSFRDLDYFARSWWELRPALEAVDTMYDPLYVLRDIFDNIWPWHYIWKGHNYIYRHTDNAVYTWEQAMLKEKNMELAEPLKRDVIIKFRHDTDIAVMKYYAKIIKAIILPPFEAVIHPVAKHLIDPLANSIPEPLREFIDIKQMFEDLYHGIIDDSIAVVLRSA